MQCPVRSAFGSMPPPPPLLPAGEAPCVLDLGAGSGALALLAAKAGAPQVVAVEAHPGLVKVARSCAAANGVSTQVRC
jgi:predicted RNA methylase